MLAIIGLLGLAFAGTAFVGLTPSEEADLGPNNVDSDSITLAQVDVAAVIEDVDDLIDDVTGLVSTDGLDVVFGGAGNDMADGQAGSDYLDGRGGDDVLSGGDDDDQVHGGTGNDDLSGDPGDDQLFGHVGDDDLSGGTGNDRLHGGDGDDHADGGYDDDDLLGGYGNDTLIGGAGQDNLQGSEGNDVLDGVTGEENDAERDFLNGSEGEDTLIGNDGDVMSGGADADRFEIDSGMVSIMDFADDDVLVMNYDGAAPDLTTQTTGTGILLLANGTPVANLYGLTSFDTGSVQLVAS